MSVQFEGFQKVGVINFLKNLLAFVVKAVIAFLKAQVLRLVWGWALWGVGIIFVVGVVIALAVWYFVGR